jgi:formylglycine-generating enzyme required for sulfatase activity/nucleoside phosphorylase
MNEKDWWSKYGSWRTKVQLIPQSEDASNGIAMFFAGRAVILTAKQEESLPVCAHLCDCQNIEVGGTIYTYGVFVARHLIWEVFVVETGMGSEEAAVFTEQAILTIHPDVVLFVGIAGGFKSKVAIGDVVVANYVYSYESGRQDSVGFYARPHSQRPSHRLEQRARAEIRSKSWQGFIPGRLAVTQPRAVVGPIATGAKVLASRASQVAEIIRSHYNDTLAVEMEGSGFHKAAHMHATSVDALMIRGISDILDGKTATDLQGYQDIAACHAAAFAFALLSNLSYNGTMNGWQSTRLQFDPSNAGQTGSYLSRQAMVIEREVGYTRKGLEARKHVDREKQALQEQLVPASMRSKGFIGQSINGIEVIIPPVVVIPAGPFIMGSDKRQDDQAFDNEMPQQIVVLETFEMALYPLTVAEYACFVRATQQPQPNDWSNQQEYEDHPVVWISWQDACAYVHWLAQVSDQLWRLPNEAEWEKAARGNDGRIYPWGNVWHKGNANTNDGGPMGTTPVGSYPGGRSPYEIYDMAGNVMEWTSSLYKAYPYELAGERDHSSMLAIKVLRGGSWNYSPGDARVAYRDCGDVSGFANLHVGMRVACGVETDRR